MSKAQNQQGHVMSVTGEDRLRHLLDKPLNQVKAEIATAQEDVAKIALLEQRLRQADHVIAELRKQLASVTRKLRKPGRAHTISVCAQCGLATCKIQPRKLITVYELE